MKKVFTLLGFLGILITLSAQDEDMQVQGKGELRLDAFSLIAFKYIDGTYENLLNEESGVGVNLQFTLDSNQEDLGVVRTFSLTPFYRQYFSKKYAKGFFVEGFMTYAQSKEYYYDYSYILETDTYIDRQEVIDYNTLAIGISIGGKFVSKRGFVAEIFGGIGRNLLDVDEEYSISEIIGRGGIALGYRF